MTSSKPLKLLFVIPYVPNPVRVRPFQFIRALMQRGHEITLATLPVGDEEQADIFQLQKLGVRIIAQPMPVWLSLFNSVVALPSGIPLQAVYSRHPLLVRRLDKELRFTTFDAVHVEHLRGSHYAQHLRQKMDARNVPVIWDSVDSISHLFEQAAQNSLSWRGKLMTRLELNRTRRYEGMLVHQFDRTIVTSPIDKSALEEISSTYYAPSAGLKPAPIEVIPNGVDLESFGYVNGAHRKAARIVFSGKMSYHANVTAAVHLVRDIMPAVWAERPDAEVWIVGKDPAPEIRLLETADVNTVHKGQRAVVVTGTVPDVNAFLQEATVAVAPLRYGAGIQNKVLEAMACGAPVVATRKATAALLAKPGQDLLVTETDSDFSQSILQLLDNPAQRTELGRRGRQFVEQNHTWSGAACRLEEIYRTARNNGSPVETNKEPNQKRPQPVLEH